MEKTNLADLARRAAENNGNLVTNDHEVAQPVETSEDEPVIVVGQSSVQENQNPFSDEPPENAGPKPIELDLSDDEINNITPTVNLIKKNTDFTEEKNTYKKRLILDGFSPEEAEEAAVNWIKKKADAANTDENDIKDSDVAVIKIDKTNTAKEDLQLTPEEHEKLVPTKAIKLVLVEDADLKSIEIENVSTERKVDYIRNLEGSLSKYSVPIPIYGDYVSFSGAQLIQIANMVTRDDDRLEDDLNRKASLIYSKLIGGSLLKKTNAQGKTIMSYQEFTNKFSYMDVDMAIYAILCASNPEEGSTELTCNKCNHSFEHKYNFKRLMTIDGLSESVKQRYEDILTNRTNDIALKQLHDASNGAHRYKSPFTNNIYDVAAPSIARMIDVFKRINQEDSIMVHNSAFASYLNSIYIYNSNTGKYLQIKDDEVDLMLDTISDIPQDDITMLQKQIIEMTYSPRFALVGNCPSCGTHFEVPVSVDNLLFFKQQDLQREIE